VKALNLLQATGAAIQTRGDRPPREFVIFMVVWVILGITSFLFFHFNRNAALKRTIWPAFIVAIGIIFGGFLFYFVGRQQAQILYVAVPAIILISFLNMRTVRFCDSCGKTLYRQPIFSRTQFCPYCGAQLGDKTNV
jgi:uncharacterized membrane protein YfcA